LDTNILTGFVLGIGGLGLALAGIGYAMRRKNASANILGQD